MTDPTSETPLYLLHHFSICTCFLVWYLEKKRRCRTKKKTVEKSINPSASNDHPWIDNYFRDRNVSNFETLKELSDDLWNKKWTFWLTLFLVEPSQLFIGRRLSNYHGHIVPEHLPTKQVRATSPLQEGSPGNNPRKLISSLSRYIIQRPYLSSSR